MWFGCSSRLVHDALELISIHSRMQDGPPVVVLDLVRLGARAGVRARARVWVRMRDLVRFRIRVRVRVRVRVSVRVYQG